MPAKHPQVNATGIAACAACHSGKAGGSAPDPFSVHMHVAHLTADVTCTACHAWHAGGKLATPGFPGGLGPLSAGELGLVMDATADWAQHDHLAGLHARKNLVCAACHRDEVIPDANSSIPNAQCVSCHGGLDKVAATFKGPSYMNPHASHLGVVSCTACHSGHETSRPYCLNCHSNFVMPIPGGPAPPPPAAAKP